MKLPQCCYGVRDGHDEAGEAKEGETAKCRDGHGEAGEAKEGETARCRGLMRSGDGQGQETDQVR